MSAITDVSTTAASAIRLKGMPFFCFLFLVLRQLLCLILSENQYNSSGAELQFLSGTVRELFIECEVVF